MSLTSIQQAAFRDAAQGEPAAGGRRGPATLGRAGELDEVALAYAITIHKSQGSEFPAVVIPLATQQYLLLQRNLVYTGITRGKKRVVVVGQRKALAIAVRNNKTEQRFSGLLTRLKTPA